MNDFKEHVLTELVVCGIYTSAHEDDPKKALQDAITWNVEVGLDPLVSERAEALVEKGRQEILTSIGLNRDDCLISDTLESNTRICKLVLKNLLQGHFYNLTNEQSAPLAYAMDSLEDILEKL